MRDEIAPDWLLQLIWFGAGICATGAVWYFLSKGDTRLVIATASSAIALALLAVLLHTFEMMS